MLTCCHGNIHTSAASLDRYGGEDPRDRWERFSNQVKAKGYWWRNRAERTFKKESLKFEKAKSQHSENNTGKSDGNKGSDFPSTFLGLLPSPAKFNSFFDKGLSKLPSGSDLVNKVPAQYRPYLQLSRVDKPTGAWLLWLPGAWGICLAAPTFGLPSIPLLTLFGAGKYKYHLSQIILMIQLTAYGI